MSIFNPSRVCLGLPAVRVSVYLCVACLRVRYKVFNMGHRMEIYCAPEVASEIIRISQSFSVNAWVVMVVGGRVFGMSR